MNYYKKWIIALVLIAIVAAAGVAYYMYNKPHADIAGMKTDHMLTASELYASFDENEKVANEEYLNKVIEVSGKVVGIEQSNEGNKTFILEGGGLMGGVKCEMDTHSQHDLDQVSTGDKVTLKGICTGYLMDVVMVRCILIPNS